MSAQRDLQQARASLAGTRVTVMLTEEQTKALLDATDDAVGTVAEARLVLTRGLENYEWTTNWLRKNVQRFEQEVASERATLNSDIPVKGRQCQARAMHGYRYYQCLNHASVLRDMNGIPVALCATHRRAGLVALF